MKLILVPVADRPECRAALDRALELADACSGSVIGCHLRPPRDRDKGVDHGNRLFGIHKWPAISQGLSEIQIEANREAAENLFKQRVAEKGFTLIEHPELGQARTARWAFVVGSLDKLFSTTGRIADASLVSRPNATAKGPGSSFMLAALLETGRPVIVLPQAPAETLGTRVLVAWNQSIEAIRAVTAAIPILQQANSVHVVSSGLPRKAGPKPEALVEYLKYWGIDATSSRTKGSDASVEILKVFKSEGSDLLVMGAYSHGRFRENVFGGVTEDLLIDSQIPVFALHS